MLISIEQQRDLLKSIMKKTNEQSSVSNLENVNSDDLFLLGNFISKKSQKLEPLAFKLLTMASQKGHSNALLTLAEFYKEGYNSYSYFDGKTNLIDEKKKKGKGVEKDLGKAVESYEKLAQNGHPFANVLFILSLNFDFNRIKNFIIVIIV